MPSIWEVEAGGIEFKASLGYISPHLKNKQKKTERQAQRQKQRGHTINTSTRISGSWKLGGGGFHCSLHLLRL